MIRGGSRGEHADSIALPAPDVDASVRFYVETLGMKLVAAGPHGHAVIDAGDGFLLRLDAALAEGSRTTPPITLYTKVPLSQAIAIYENRGVRFVRFDARSGFCDPAGNAFVLAEEPNHLAGGS
jgi:catechol 2,3-dioxygenase-like lactoylglutathione lyase family enzyme